MRFFLAICTVAATLVAHEAQAMMAPKYERARQLGTALDHLREIARTLKDPIDKIEYVVFGGEIRFWAGKCFVPVVVKLFDLEYDKSGKAIPPAPGSQDYTAIVGKMQCP
jgi:hypothetical protein